MESLERMVARMDAAAEAQARWERAWAIGYNDAFNGTSGARIREYRATRNTFGWCNADRAAYHDGWMAQITE